jgi:hypothetical protein
MRDFWFSQWSIKFTILWDVGGHVEVDHGDSMHLSNVSQLQHDYMALHPRRLLNFYSIFAAPRFTGDFSNRTVSGRLQHSTQDHTLQQSVLLPANTGPQDPTAQRSLFLASPDPTGLEVQF